MARLRLTLRCSSSAYHLPPPIHNTVWPAFSLEPFVIFDRPSLCHSPSSPGQLKIVCPYARHCCHWLWPRSVGILSQIANEPSQNKTFQCQRWHVNAFIWFMNKAFFPQFPPIKLFQVTQTERDTLLVNILWMTRSVPITICGIYAMHSLQCPSWEYQIPNLIYISHKSRLDIITIYTLRICFAWLENHWSCGKLCVVGMQRLFSKWKKFLI